MRTGSTESHCSRCGLHSLSTSRLRARSSVLIDLVREPAALDSLQNDEIRLFTARVVRFVETRSLPGAAVRQELDLSHANDDTFLSHRQSAAGGVARKSSRSSRHTEKVAYELVGERLAILQRVAGVGAGKELSQRRKDCRDVFASAGRPAAENEWRCASLAQRPALPESPRSPRSDGSNNTPTRIGRGRVPRDVPVCAIVEWLPRVKAEASGQERPMFGR